MSRNIEFAYDIYIGAPPAKVWQGIVDGDMTKHCVYGTRLESELKKGAPYAYVGGGGFKMGIGTPPTKTSPCSAARWLQEWVTNLILRPPSF